MENRTLLQVAALLLASMSGISGCLQTSDGKTDAPPSTTEMTTPTTSSSRSETPFPAPEPTANEIRWSSCTGLGIGIETPAPLVNGARPLGWEKSADILNAAITDLYYTVIQCERVSWGSFERGPVFTMMERHNDFEAPEKCREDAGQLRVIVQSIWFSDPDLVEFARTRFGMPAFLGEFGFNFSTTASAQMSIWTWKLPGGNVSEMSFPSRDDALLNTAEPVWRQYWIDGEGVSYMDLNEHFQTPEPAPGAAYGRLPSPMLWGQSMPEDSFFTPDRADQKLEASYSASISRFGDLECNEPL